MDKEKTNKIQEDQYHFPYHYIDFIMPDAWMLRMEYLGLLEIMKKFVLEQRPEKLLDVGCGDGRLIYELKNDIKHCVGVDFSERAINFAKMFNPESKFLTEDINTISKQEKYDVVVLMETLEHIPVNEIDNVLGSIKNLLRPDGKLIISVPSKAIPLSEKHFQHFSKDSLSKTLLPNFETVKIDGYSKLGLPKFVFDKLRALTLITSAIARNTRLNKFMESFAVKFYRKYLLHVNSENSIGLIGIFKPIK